jgi:uncharacterized membrane protein
VQSTIILIKRGSGVPSTLFLVGSIFMLIGNLIGIGVNAYVYSKASTMSMANVASVISFSAMVVNFIQFCGVILIIISFWESANRLIIKNIAGYSQR